MSELETRPAVFKLFGNRSGAMLFDDAATTVAEALNVEIGQTVEKAPALRVDPSQFEQAKSVLESNGYQVLWNEPKPTIIVVSGQNATVYGQAAIVASEHLNKPSGLTEKEVPKLKFDRAQVEELKSYLSDRGFKVQVEERESKHKPKVILRESEDDRYFVYDRSAQNLAEAKQCELDRTPGGRPMLVFDRAEYKQIQAQYGDSLDISTKPLKLEATIATYEGNRGRGGVITGKPALEAAGLMNLETGWTRPTGAGSSMEKLNLNEAQIETAAQLLRDQGYQVEVKSLDLTKVANVSRWNDGSIRLFGHPAEQVASALNLPIEQTQRSTPMLRVTADQRESALETLQTAGYEIRDSEYKPPTSPAATKPDRSPPVRSGSAQPTHQPEQSPQLPTDPQAQLKSLVRESVGQLVRYFQSSQNSQIELSDSGLKAQFDKQTQTLTAQTPDGRSLVAPLETRRIQSDFTVSDCQNLARLATATQQQTQSVQSDPERD